jgi:hypothetical protein
MDRLIWLVYVLAVILIAALADGGDRPQRFNSTCPSSTFIAEVCRIRLVKR